MMYQISSAIDEVIDVATRSSSAIDEAIDVVAQTNEVLAWPKHPKASQVHQGQIPHLWEVLHILVSSPNLMPQIRVIIEYSQSTINAYSLISHNCGSH